MDNIKIEIIDIKIEIIDDFDKIYEIIFSNEDNLTSDIINDIKKRVDELMIRIELNSEKSLINEGDYLKFCNKIKNIYDCVVSCDDNEIEIDVGVSILEYQGITYYKADNNDVYILDDDRNGVLVGVWNIETKEIIFNQ